MSARKMMVTAKGKILYRDTQLHTYTDVRPGRYWYKAPYHFFRVYGEPIQEPKKDIGHFLGKDKKSITTLLPKDYRTTQGPDGKPFKWDIGFCQRWKDHVCRTVSALMSRQSLDPYPVHVPLALGLIFYRSKPQDPKSWLPVTAPDRDNYDYAIHNCLKSTKEKNSPGKYPEGVLYYDDNQLCAGTPWDMKVYADTTELPGVLISVTNANNVAGEICRLAYPDSAPLRLL